MWSKSATLVALTEWLRLAAAADGVVVVGGGVDFMVGCLIEWLVDVCDNGR